jgi:heme A synthase
MLRFRNLAIASTAATFVLVSIGGLVRATKSGLGCGPNWPHCPGEPSRALIIEATHRGAAGIVVILLGLLAVVALKKHRDKPALVWPAVAAFGLVIFQALLGAVVVWLELKADTVVLHLATAMALLALLVYLSAASLAAEGGLNVERDRKISRTGGFAAGAVLVVLLVGSYVTGRGAGNAFDDWPLMGGALLPDLSIEVIAVHFAHRLVAAVGAVIVAIAAFKIVRQRERFPLQAKLAGLGAGAFVIEILIGAANVWTDLNPVMVTAHLAIGAVIWASFVSVAVVSHPVVDAAGRARSRRSHAALEGAH